MENSIKLSSWSLLALRANVVITEYYLNNNNDDVDGDGDGDNDNNKKSCTHKIQKVKIVMCN